MKSAHVRHVLAFLATLVVATSGGSADAQLLGTKLGIRAVFQATPADQPVEIGFTITAAVRDPGVEFPDLSQTTQDNEEQLVIVPVAIDAGDNFIEITILPTDFVDFAPGYFNGYVFTFGAASGVSLGDAMLDPARTTIGLTDADIAIEDNRLSVNVAEQRFGIGDTIFVRLTSRKR